MGNVVAFTRPESAPEVSRKTKKLRLTKRLVDGLQPDGAGDRFVWDGDVPGFGVRVKPNGARSYVIQYRNEGGRSRRLTLGRHGVLTAEQARDLARDKLGEVRKGGDPASERAMKRGAPTIAALCDRYLKEYSELHNKPSSVRQNAGLITRRVKPAFGPIKVAELTRDDVMRFHGSLHSIPYDANRSLSLISKMMNLAEVWGLRPLNSNPCRHVRRFKETKRTRFLTLTELAHVGSALAKAEQGEIVSASVALALKLYLLTGCAAARFSTSSGRTSISSAGSYVSLTPRPEDAMSLSALPHWTYFERHRDSDATLSPAPIPLGQSGPTRLRTGGYECASSLSSRMFAFTISAIRSAHTPR